jgi:hypothetical protein
MGATRPGTPLRGWARRTGFSSATTLGENAAEDAPKPALQPVNKTDRFLFTDKTPAAKRMRTFFITSF